MLWIDLNGFLYQKITIFFKLLDRLFSLAYIKMADVRLIQRI